VPALALRVGEVKEAQCQGPAAIAEAHQQLAPAAKHDFGQQHFALDERVTAGKQRADGQDMVRSS